MYTHALVGIQVQPLSGSYYTTMTIISPKFALVDPKTGLKIAILLL